MIHFKKNNNNNEQNVEESNKFFSHTDRTKEYFLGYYLIQ